MHFKDSAPLQRDEETRLVTLAKRRNKAARAKLIQHNLRGVVAIANEVNPRSGIDVDDLIQEGVIGLDKAIDGFQLKRKLRFWTYAIWWVKAYIKRAAQRTHDKQFLSLDVTPSGEDDGQETYKDLIEDPLPDPEEAALSAEDAKIVRESLHLLNPQMKVVAMRRLIDDQPTLDDVGQQLGVSRERVRQLEGHTKEKLARILNNRMATDGAEIREVVHGRRRRTRKPVQVGPT